METTGSRPLGRAFHTAILGEETKIVVHGGISRHGSNDDCYELDIVHNQVSCLCALTPIHPLKSMEGLTSGIPSLNSMAEFWNVEIF